MRTYTIIDTNAITDQMIEDCVQTSRDTVRKSVDGSKSILKWIGNNPSWVAALGLTVYTGAELSAEIQKPEWTPVSPE
jgi:hypothetical protein|tara:strand:- start:370 stop:603 length:234 start_codon:yes stop_codon:yes gene_type:complete